MSSTTSTSSTSGHTVQIQQLSPVQNYQVHQPYQTPKEDWKKKKCKHWEKTCPCNVLNYSENVTANVRSHSNAFYGAFLHAYNSHAGITLSPDDVWMVIRMEFSEYINANAEAMRNKFVNHDGKKKLNVTTWNEQQESQWGEFFQLMVQAIQDNTNPGVVDLLKCNFSTTGQFETYMSTASIMDSFKQFFSYGRCIPCCGITHANFLGTLQDWELVLSKTKELTKFAVTKQWQQYVDGVVPILEQFIQTYKGNPDVDFWNKVMNITHGRIGSGSTTYVTGWILNFFGLKKKVDSGDIPSRYFEVPVELDNKQTGEKKTVYIIGGFGGVRKDENSYRPQMSMVVMTAPEEEQQQQKIRFR